MSKPNLGMPERAKPRGRRPGRGSLLIGLLLTVIVLAVAVFFILPRLFGPQGNAVPLVQIRVPSPGAQVRAQDGQVVLIQTYEAKTITRYELWVDGKAALFQTPSQGATELPSSIQMIWRPATPGERMLVARAYDASGRIGTSQPVVVEVIAPPEDELVAVTIEIKPGDTLAGIAQGYNVSPEQVRQYNPGVPESPTPGTELVVPVPRDQLPEGFLGVDHPGDNNPGPAPETTPALPPQGEGVGPAPPAGDGGAGGLPWDMGPGFGASEPPTAPQQIHLELLGGCGLRVRWTDNSTSETGFRIYRSAAGNNFRAIKDLGANDALAELTYDDQVPLGGHYEYYVAAVNAGGESPGPIAGIDVAREGCAIQAAPLSWGRAAAILQFEALSLTTRNDFDTVHCFLSLARLEPHSRIPRLEDVFLSA